MGSIKKSTCVVTGAGGFIGSHLAQALLKRGAKVRALVHYNALGSIGHLAETRESLSDDESKRLEIIAGDVRDGRCMRELIEGSDVVFHLAALIGIPYSYSAPESYIDTNVRGTMHVLEACRDAGVERVIHTSTSEAYGTARTESIREQHLLQAQSPYSASKIAADKLAESYHLSFDLPLITLRPFNTYGPRQSLRAVIPTIMAQVLSEKCDKIRLGSLDPERDLTYVGDTVEAFCMAAEAPIDKACGRLYNLGTGRGISIGDLARMILKITASDKPLVQSAERKRPEKSEVMRLLSDPSRIQKEIGWQAMTPLETGLQATIDWLQAHPAQLAEAEKYII
ncbi:MAG: SDR family NAD(P)-dependent oxidoreductase [Candidatus Sumerlaeia bacterium]